MLRELAIFTTEYLVGRLLMLVRTLLGSNEHTPTGVKAQPTLRGLRPIPEPLTPAPGDIYSWEQVSLFSEHDEVHGEPYSEDGGPLRPNGRAIKLEIPTEKAGRTARRAQIRRFKALWKNGKLSVTEDYAGRPGDRVSIRSIVLQSALALVFFAVFLRIWVLPKPDMDRHVQGLMTVLFIPGFFLFVAFPLFLVLKRRRSAKSINVAQATFRTDGLSARLRDGGEVSREWTMLKEINQQLESVRVEFQDGTVLHFPALPRTQIVSALATQDYLPHSVARQAESNSRGLTRALILAAVGLGLIGWFMYTEARSGVSLKAMCTGPVVIFVGLAAVLLLTISAAWLRTRRERAAQQRKRVQGRQTQPLAR